MKRAKIAFLCLILLAGCDRDGHKTAPQLPASLVEARREFRTHLVRKMKGDEPVPEPPAGVFSIVRYNSPVGELAAYLTPEPRDGKRHPAIIWITGGDCNSIGDVWTPASPEDDQTASAYRKAGIVMMFPSLRGGNENPGFEERFCGEIDDVLAAADFLARQPFVDPKRIYLGGHSSGGTLVLLVAESSDRFRAVFSFGPIDTVTGYGSNLPLPVNTRDRREIDIRSPIRWLSGIKTPTFVFEGGRQPSNASALKALAAAAPPSSPARFFPVPGATHFSVLEPMNRLVAAKICRDMGTKTNLTFTQEELAGLMR